MAQFLEETIQSVLTQDYPNIEYFVMDGGSEDGTLSILEKYRDRIRFRSEPDEGPADAINRGFLMSHGAVFGYLCADDTYLPGAITAAVHYLFDDSREVAVVYGEAYWADAAGRIIRCYPTKPFDPQLLARECFICQPASFMRREAFESVGMMNPNLHFSFDYDLWIRIAKHYTMVKIDRYLATSRMHHDNITLRQRGPVLIECMRTLRRHYGYVPLHWAYAYSCYLVDRTDRTDQFFEPVRPSVLRRLLTLLVGIRYNWCRPLRFCKELLDTLRETPRQQH